MQRVSTITRRLAVLLLWPVLGLAQVDTRILVLDNGREGPVQLAMQQLVTDYELQTRTVDDPEYKAVHSYLGIDFKTLLTRAGFPPGVQLLLVCSDGYSIPFDSSVLLGNEWQGLLALRDTAASGDNYFVPLDHGGEKVDLAPFYLVWSPHPAASGNSATTAAELPWPYQLTEIRRLQPADYQSAMPAATAPAAVQEGFELYFRHCIKCHSVNGSGGTLGPALDAEHGLADVLAQSNVRELILQISKYVPASKMPDFDDTLSEQGVDAVLAYLTAMAR